jgi:hypothetical protein
MAASIGRLPKYFPKIRHEFGEDDADLRKTFYCRLQVGISLHAYIAHGDSCSRSHRDDYRNSVAVHSCFRCKAGYRIFPDDRTHSSKRSMEKSFAPGTS